MDRLAERTISGAEFDSSVRDPPPRCHPGTRIEIITTVQAWLLLLEPERRLLWLYGPAGVGKSAIIQSLAELEADAQRLAATLFFSRPFRRGDPSRVWTTISFQLAVKEPLYLAYVQEQLHSNPKLFEKGMREQFRKLVAEPFGQRRLVNPRQPLSIFLDGLDECDGEKAQVEIIQLVSEFVREYPDAPLLWVIASRPEQHLKIAFEQKHVQQELWTIYIPVDSDEACKDVELYLRAEFEDIRRRHPYVIPVGPSQWPQERDIVILVHAASGLFAFASAIARFVDDPLVGDPVSQLEDIVSIARKTSLFVKSYQDPLLVLHVLYTQIIELIPKNTYHAVTRRILGLTMLKISSGGWNSGSTSFWHLCNLLGIKQNVAYGSLHKLHSVLRIPSPEDADTTPIIPFHASFFDYLCNEDASGQFWINVDETSSVLWRCHFRVLQQAHASSRSSS